MADVNKNGSGNDQKPPKATIQRISDAEKKKEMLNLSESDKPIPYLVHLAPRQIKGNQIQNLSNVFNLKTEKYRQNGARRCPNGKKL